MLKQKDKIMNEWLQGKGQMKRKAKVTGNEEIIEVLWEWFTNAISKTFTYPVQWFKVKLSQ
jgi:hypothetical protein